MIRVKSIRLDLCKADFPPGSGVDTYDMNDKTDHGYFHL